jgi:DNA invertase Pin-like site-specific DNA recombinase
VTTARPKAYSYLRFSTPEQSKGDSQRRQTQLAEAYASRHGLGLDNRLTFKDLGVSAYQGRNLETGQLGAFLAAVNTGLVERGSYLLVESLDRISRRTARKAVRVMENLCEAGITVVTLSDNQVYTEERLDDDPMSFLMAFVIHMRGAEESKMKASRLSAAWVGKRGRIEAGEKLTAKVPGWLWLDKATGKIKVHRERAAIVRRIFKDTLRGIGKHAIARSLNEEKVPVFGRGERWHRSYIDKILKSSTVVGTLTPHTFTYTKAGKKQRKPLAAIPDYYPAVIDADDFARVESLQQTATPLRGKHAASGVVRNLFGGLGRCPLCAGSLVRVNKGEPPKGGTYLVCSKAREGAGCKYRVQRYGPLETAFLREATALLNTVPSGKSADAVKIDREIDNLETILLELPEWIENVVTAIARGQQRGTSSVALEERLVELESQDAPMRQRLANLRRQQTETSGALVAKKCEELEEALSQPEIDRAVVNALLRQLFSGIVVDATDGQMTFHWKHGGESSLTYAWPKGKPAKRSATKHTVKQRVTAR